MIDKTLSAANASEAAHGVIAYKQELYDGIKLMSEVNQINQVSILNEKKLDCEETI